MHDNEIVQLFWRGANLAGLHRCASNATVVTVETMHSGVIYQKRSNNLNC